MSLALAIEKNSKALAVAHTTYKQEVIATNSLVTSVLTSKLPPLHETPPDFKQYTQALESAKADALNWVNVVMSRLLEVPSDVRTFNTNMDLSFANALSNLDTLISNPNDAQALATLKADLKNMQGTLELVTAFISGSVQAIQNFGDNKLPQIGAELLLIAKKSSADAKADQQQIDQLLSDIESFEAEIKSLTAAIVALAIADGIALTLGLVASIAAFPVGLVAWLILGPAIIVATYEIAIDGEKIKGLQKKIDYDKSLIKGVTADVSTLQILAKRFTKMAGSTEAVETSLKQVLAAWEGLQADVAAAVTDLNTLLADANSKSFSQAKAELASAKHEWDLAYAAAGDLHLDMQVNDAPLKVGMTKSQIKEATSKAQTLGVILYYNTVGS